MKFLSLIALVFASKFAVAQAINCPGLATFAATENGLEVNYDSSLGFSDSTDVAYPINALNDHEIFMTKKWGATLSIPNVLFHNLGAKAFVTVSQAEMPDLSVLCELQQ